MIYLLRSHQEEVTRGQASSIYHPALRGTRRRLVIYHWLWLTMAPRLLILLISRLPDLPWRVFQGAVDHVPADLLFPFQMTSGEANHPVLRLCRCP